MDKMTTPISVIRIFEQVRKTITEIDTPPLTRDTIKVNSDEYAKLGDDEAEYPFARIAIDFPSGNNDFTFCMDFLSTGVALTILNLEWTWHQYEELGESNQQIARVITDVLVCLANGQIAMLVTLTEDDDRMQAFELLYRRPNRRNYDAICTGTMFQSARKLKNREYKTDLYANKSAIKQVDLNVGSAQQLLILDDDLEMMRSVGRKNIGGLHQPLTYELFTEAVCEYSEKAGQQAADKLEKNVDKAFDAAEKKMGIHGKTFWEQVALAARWRHFELMLEAALLFVWTCVILGDSTGIWVGLVILCVVLVAWLFRHRYPYPQVLYVLAPLAYGLFIFSTLWFSTHLVNHWFAWALAVIMVVSLAECLFFDVRSVVHRLRRLS